VRDELVHSGLSRDLMWSRWQVVGTLAVGWRAWLKPVAVVAAEGECGIWDRNRHISAMLYTAAIYIFHRRYLDPYILN
jgi:hypothetical protein